MTLCGAGCVAGGPVTAQCQARHAPVEGGPQVISSLGFRVEEAPGDGSDLVEEIDGGLSARAVDRACSDEKTEVGIDFFG